MSPFVFGALDDELCAYSSARAALLPVPYDGTTSYKTGTREGPAAIIAASQALELFDEELLFTPAAAGIATLSPVEPDARGPQQTVAAIARAAARPLSDGKFTVAVGGEHTISLGCLQAHRDLDGDIHVLQIDAHADLRDSYQGSPYSHACVMRRALAEFPIVQVGLRSLSAEEHELIEERDLRPFSMNVIRATPGWMDEVIERLGPKVYLTLDLDGLDPSVCPGVGTPEPGGLGWYELIDLLRRVFSRRDVVGADVVECLPLPGQHVTEFIAARLIYKLFAYHFAPARGRKE
ncbi:MAG TPA: agmatinase [Myxococcota bacterium]|nr:agmatinase [Myxococcota bacterium]